MGRTKRGGNTSSQKRTSDMSSFRLFDLPLETRLRIYRACFEPPYPASWDIGTEFGCDHKTSHQSPLLICRQVHAEIWPVYAEYHVFVFSKPLDFGNNFLSILPPQRLLAIRHVTWIQSNDLEDSQRENFERLWWHYLDFFVQLDTFAVEHRDDRDRTTARPGPYQPFGVSGYSSAWGFDRCIPLLVGLLQQGGTRKPRKVTRVKLVARRSHRKLRTTDAALPETRRWVLHAAYMHRYIGTTGHRNGPYARRLKVVIRYIPAHSDDNLVHTYGIAEMFASWRNMSIAPTQFWDPEAVSTVHFSPDKLWAVTEADSDSSLRSCVIRWTDTPNRRGILPVAARVKLDPLTHVVQNNAAAPDDSVDSVDVVNIVGEWIRHD